MSGVGAVEIFIVLIIVGLLLLLGLVVVAAVIFVLMRQRGANPVAAASPTVASSPSAAAGVSSSPAGLSAAPPPPVPGSPADGVLGFLDDESPSEMAKTEIFNRQQHEWEDGDSEATEIFRSDLHGDMLDAGFSLEED